MPLYKEWNIGAHALAAIWKIEEPEAFFQEQTQIATDIRNDRRRIEHLAGRYLLRHLKEDFPLFAIGKDEHDKPRLSNNEFFFSISHSWPYVAAVIDPHSEAGIDIQTWHPNIERIKHKFLSPREQELLSDDPRMLTLAWAAKEAAYKWNGKRGVDFIDHLPIDFFNVKENNYEIMINFKLSTLPQIIFIENIITTDFACCYVSNVD